MKSLFKEFTKTSKKQWLAKVEKDLKGKPLESLDWKINEDWVVSPFAHADDFKELPDPIFNKKNSNSWEKGVRILVKNYKSANREALSLLENGAEALVFEINDNVSKTELVALLDKIEIGWISTHFILNNKSWKSIVINFLKIIQERNLDSKKIKASFQFHPSFSKNDLNKLEDYFGKLPSTNFITIHTRNRFQGKENVISELAELIFQTNKIIEKWQEANLNIKNLLHSIQFRIQLDHSYYINIAKIRALKLLWNLLTKSWISNSNLPCQIEALLIPDTKDENWNKITATSQALSAVIGGVERLTIYPSDYFKNKKGTQNQQRLGLNIQHLMELESYMNRVVDPAAGSYFIEQLTDDLAEQAWNQFVKRYK